MIDVDGELVRRGPLSQDDLVGTLDDKNSVVIPVDRVDRPDIIGSGKAAIGRRNVAADDHLG